MGYMKFPPFVQVIILPWGRSYFIVILAGRSTYPNWAQFLAPNGHVITHLASWEIWIDCVALKVINSQMPKLRTCLQTPGITLDKHFMLHRPNEYCCSAFMSHFISALLSLTSCANFAPSKGHVSRHSSLKQECVTSISLTSQFTARFLPATGCGLTTRKDYCSSPSVARLITGEA